jgi:hypothetical protein
MLAAVYVDPDGQVSDLGGDHAVVLDPDPDPVHVEDRVHLVQGPRLPHLDFIENHFGDI